MLCKFEPKLGWSLAVRTIGKRVKIIIITISITIILIMTMIMII